ncbi:unnamed protein product [Rotaria sordida]|uniref:Uncharacterized protein n=1 Tax=Rotaria sordida TaxID=392033 RepID=A0A818UY87_9BILA|nr:unnamed protein product [Rotaria sordida]
MCTDLIVHDNVTTPSDSDPGSVSQSTVNQNCYQSCINSACFKYTKIILIIIYSLNIIAWGGMLFLILVGAANKTMSDEYTRKIWIEIDSQILNGLFCVTGLGLIPWRVRDLYQLYSKKHQQNLRRRHSYTTNIYWIGIVVWTFIANSLFQIGMAVCMWSMDMNTRPAWLVGLFVGLGCCSGAFAVHILLHVSEASQCSKLNLTPLNTNSDDNYSILTERFQSSNIIKVLLIVQQPVSSTSWFLMGASDYSELIGSWQPITSADGEVIECSVFSEQAVTNKKSSLENPNRSEFTFYWMAPPSFSSIVIFVATIFDNSTTNDNNSLRYIQSTPIEIKQTQGPDRYRDVDRTFCTSSPCLNGGSCSYDDQYSYCQCVAPWNGVFCNLQYFHLMFESTLPFNSDFYFNTLNSPSYTRLSTDLFAWLNNAFNTLPSNRMYSINFVAPSPSGTYISVSMAVTPTGVSYTSVILSALVTALARNNTTPLGYQLSIDPASITEPVTQDSTPYTSCVFPFTLALVDYNFCVPLAPNFVCSRSRVIDRNTTLNSLDCSRDIFEYVSKDPCFPNICLNGGTCITVNGLATCNCPEYFTGSRCDQLYGCNPITNSRAITCANGATCRDNVCICTSNNTVGTLCEIISGNTGCVFPFTYMDVAYPSCAVISGQSLCVVRNSGINGLFPISLAGCGAPQCRNNPCGNRGACQDTVSGSFRCINCATGYSGYFCELQYQSFQMALNVTYIPDYQNLSSNASQQLQTLINQTLNVAFINITNGGVRPDIISLIENPDGTTSAIINVNTNYLNFLNNSTQSALNNLPGISIVPVNTTRECAPWYIYGGRNVTGCITNPFNVPICSLTDNFDRDGQFTACSEPINLNLCNNMFCGDGRCVVTSRNLSYCQCPNGITGENCDQLIRCSDVNCLNNGTCMMLSTGYYRCMCPPGYGGTFCQYNITDCVFPFVDNQNRSHNTCITTSDYLGGTVPWCRNILGQPRSCLIDYCAQRPCVYGTCIPTSRWAFGSSYPSFICNCTDGFTGMLCTHAYFRLKSLYLVPNISSTTLNALESPTTQTYQNISRMFRNLVRNRTNSSFDFLPLVYTTFRNPTGNYYQISADLSFPGNISQTEIADILTPILTDLPPEFNATYIDNGLLEPDSIQPLNPAPNCTLPYMYNSQSLAVCHVDNNGLAYCAYGQSYILIDRKLCDASGLPTAQYTACDILNITNPCNSTANFPIRCVAADDGWNCFCEVTQTLGRDCANLDFCRNGSLLCRNNATCINRPDLRDFSCNCTDLYYGRYCENFAIAYKLFLLNYSNETSPGLPILIAILNQTIINITNGSVIATNIIITPTGEVTVVVSGKNYSVPQLQLPLIDLVNRNWTVGPYLISFNQTSLVAIETNATCVFPFAYNGVNYTTCITTGYGFPWCSATPVFTGRIIDCRNIDWCASGPCMHNGTCTVNQELGTFQCKCVDGWTGVQCAYPTSTITIVIPIGNNTYNNITIIDITKLLPNTTNGTINVDNIRPGPNNTIIITIVVNGSNVPNITWPNIINITVEPTKNIDGCVFPFIYLNRTHSTCIPVGGNRLTYCCKNANCDLNPQWQLCNDSNVCAACAPNAGCTMSQLGVISCLCPVGFGGDLCETPLDLCAQSNRSCLNNGVCIVDPNTSSAFCNCSSPGYTGAQCETFAPCLSSPCLHNGTCSGSINGTVQCNCTNCYSGPFCQNIDYCCLNVCSPNAVCLPELNGTYVCMCLPNYTGANCSILNPCTSLPCQNNGTCVNTNGSNYECLCPTGWTGMNCDTPLVNPCASLPCYNNGTCVNTNGSNYECLCPTGWTGMNCNIPVNPCASLPCHNNGTCVTTNGSNYECLCPTGWTGMNCDTPPVNPCASLPCQNNGICVISNGSNYECLCPTGWTGMNCNIPVNPCASLPCQNNGTCVIRNASSYECLCPTGWTDMNCGIPVNPCSSFPCRNNGECFSFGDQFFCACLLGFNGTYCEIPISPCESNPCLNNGTCYEQITNSSFNITGSYLGYICICNPALYSGIRCENIVPPCPTDPALPSPCLNGGTCLPSADGQTFNCFCPFPYSGTSCDQMIDPCTPNPCSPNGQCYLNLVTSSFICVCINSTHTGPLCQNLTNPCLSSPCFNGSTCIINGTNFICQCLPNRTGIYCENFLPPCTNTTCFNNGTCLYSSTTVTCLCPPLFTGPQCLQPINPCFPSPCLNNGTCLISSLNTVSCSCPTLWTGILCETLVNPCLTQPCFFGGTCLLNSTYQPICICPPTQTGLYCLETINPCSSRPCYNNGTCISNSAQTNYTCICPVLYTGDRCENLINPCLPNHCIFGTCYSLNNGTYYCACAANYTGLICDHPIDQCSLLPCVNNGTCINLGTTYSCTCPTGYIGSSCEQIINPCLSNPCRTGTCYSTGIQYICACDASHTGNLCEIPLDPCLSYPCLNNQTCLRSGTNTSYTCLCGSPYTGQRCEITVLPCTTMICLNGGTCFQTTLLTSQCLCPIGYSGTYCELISNPCQSQPCFNNGTCLSTLNNAYMCNCLPSYTGTYCEQYNPCMNFTCMNGGTCVISLSAIGGRTCICTPAYTGQLCATPISPCLSSPCVNNGVCVTIPGTVSFTCTCTPVYTGIFCEIYINPCLNYSCANGGTCYRTIDGTPICSCPSGFTGPQCLTRIDPCLSGPCLNNGICSSLLPIDNYTCICPSNYTGHRCENFVGSCSTTFCQNGGTCVYNGLNAISCICPPVWTGTSCTQRVDPCTTSNPCLNSGTCIAIFNSTNSVMIACQCLATFTGQYCQTPISPCQMLPCVNGQCLLRADGSAICYCSSQWTGAACDVLIPPCSSQPCLNNGVCYSTGINYTCMCLPGYSGLRCEIVSPTLCTLICSNNGTCAIRGQANTQICICPTGYTGIRCEVQISPCMQSPCLNNGVCLPATYANGTLGFQCICAVPYTGPICANYIPLVCGNSTCLNGGTCLVNGNQTICQCSSLFTGIHCESLINPCDSQPCVNGGTCYTTGVGRKKRQIMTTAGFYCQCPSLYTGTRCESYVSLCGSNPCQHNGTCYQDVTLNRIYCLCTPNYTGTYCNTTDNATNICTTNPSICYNGGTCRVNSSSPLGFSCTCTATTTGYFCEQPLDECQMNPKPCLNNGTCVTSLTGYMCICPNGFTGTNCSIATNPCSSQPCFRNGTCLAMGTQSYTCTCPTGYFGTRCEICDCPCHIYPCLNGGVCRSTASGGVVCTCPSGYTGVRCEISLLPCDSNPCLNGGVCLYDPTTLAMTCQCCGLATGRFCETLLNPCNTSIPYCFNGGTCVLNATMKPMCICPSTFTGVYCETYSNPCSLVTCIRGTCVMLANSTFLCLCPTGRSGRYCEIVDPCLATPGTMDPCRNGGTCIRLTSTTYTCLCPAGFTGAYCDIANPCSSMPCTANATCATLLNSSALCICPVGMTGSRCDQPISSSFCSSSPCLHNGTCIGTICICPSNTSGPTCNEIVTPCPTSSRPTLVCFNGGTCVPNSGCFCDAGFAGDDCSTPIFESCTSSTCLNGGTCVQLFNSTLICICPIGYTGSRCETYTSLCLPNPCQSNGTCIPSGTTGYICVCPPNFTGPQCNLVTNPCLYLPCLNNGTCVPLQNGDYRCICLSTFTGTQCQTILNPCLSMPCNTGTCVSINNGLAYICNCPPQLTGPTCLIANPCGIQPCLNSGTCILTGASTYTCVCPINYTGTNCQTYNLCLPNPCLNNGTCSMLTTSTISCLCTTTYYGDRCQILNPCQNPICIHGICQINSATLTAQCACYAGWTGTYCDALIACYSNPCVHGTCVQSSTSGYVCNCIAGYYGPQCQYPITQTPCDSGPCRNSGTCQVAMNGYTCLCPAYYVGINCEYINPCVLIGAPSTCQSVLTPSGNYTCSCPTDPCSSNPCQYGTCIVINSGLAYRCMCYPNYLGVHCNLPDPCSLTTCYNGGRCIATVNSDSTQVTQSCQCPSSQYFIGAFCEHYNPCISSPCMNNATCTAYVNVTCYYHCICPMGYSGERCQYSMAQIRCESVNIPNNCRNGGTCMLIGMSTQCFCTSLYTGTLCENVADICSLRVCQNGGTCLIVNGTNVICQCLPSYQGTYCEYSTDPCSVQPCFNGGQCIASFLTFTCNCAQTMYTGPRCETLISSPCRISPCLNGGTCQIVGSSYVCLCPTPFTGQICAQSINICSTIQCLNGGTCLDYGTFPICNCLISYTGDRCQYINQCYPNPPCVYGGTCIPVLYSFSCQCPTGRTGTTCQFLADDPCAGGNYRCLNGGTCIILSGTSQASCLCPTNFTGEQCEQIVSPISITVTTTITTLSSSILTIISESSSMIIGTTSSNYLNMTSAPYACDDISLACLAYSAYCAREIEFSGIPCRVLCPRTCNTCCEDYYIDGTCSLEKCQLNPQLECYCRKSCICKT